MDFYEQDSQISTSIKLRGQ